MLLYNKHVCNTFRHILVKTFKVFLSFAFISVFTPLFSQTQAEAVETSTETLQLEEGTYDESQVIVKFKDSVESNTATDVLEDADSVKAKGEGEVDEIADNTATVKVEDGKSVADAITELEDDPRVEYAEPTYYAELFEEGTSLAKSVSDPYVSQQKHITDSYAKVQEAWDVVKGEDSNVTVAIIDSGIDTDHPDLAGNIVAKASMTGTGYEDQLGHGTNVAGIISAKTNNGVGVTGVSYNAKILPIKVTDVSQGFDGSPVIKALQWVIDNYTKYNIKVVNMSLGMTYSQTVKDLIDKAYNAGIICVCASGNSYSTSGVSFPASLSNTISVGAVDANHNRVSYSNGGSNLDLVAMGSYSYTYPTSGIFTTINYGGYGDAGHGTSFAAPFVAATAALCFAANSSATPDSVKSIITSTALDLGETGKDIYYGYGQVVAKDAVEKITEKTPVYRLFNLKTGEHFYTRSFNERNMLINAVNSAWRYEGVGWYAPISEGTPVYRVYNPRSGFHLFTRSENERNALVSKGWSDEGVAWNSADASGVALNRFYNSRTGDHFYTASEGETAALSLSGSGWSYENVTMYGVN